MGMSIGFLLMLLAAFPLGQFFHDWPPILDSEELIGYVETRLKLDSLLSTFSNEASFHNMSPCFWPVCSRDVHFGDNLAKTKYSLS
jgi:hypothetical protein